MERQIFDELLGEFLLEADERIGRVEEAMLRLDAGVETDPPSALAGAGRELHTLKGNAGMMGLEELQRAAHLLEDALAEIDPAAPAVLPVLAGLDRCRALLRPLARERGEERQLEASVRVPAARLERLTDLLAEQVTLRQRLEDRLAAVEAELGASRSPARDRLRQAFREHGRIFDEVRREVLALRMVPLVAIFRGLRRLARDEAERCGKRIRVESLGEETPLDRSLVEIASEALGHLVRNAVVHGVEAPDARGRAGKPQDGTVLLRAAVGSDRVTIEVIDDGAGVDRGALGKAARRAGLAGASDEELDALL
ncbi:MAG: Hpt domain-containing protein, partial [Thermoanaerobaculia bacterium]|nr:Hpt domain-containing protein [Thermoanaerobaculia bacterium]